MKTAMVDLPNVLESLSRRCTEVFGKMVIRPPSKYSSIASLLDDLFLETLERVVAFPVNDGHGDAKDA